MAKKKAPAGEATAFTPDATIMAGILGGTIASGPAAEVQPYADAGLVTLGETDGSGLVAVTATPLAFEQYGAATEASTVGEDAITAAAYKIDATPGPVPTIKRGGGGGSRESSYPFDALPAPTADITYSFHVPKTETRKDPANSMASVVTAANQRYGTPSGQVRTREIKQRDGSKKTVTTPIYNFERKFTVRTVGADDPSGAGARVYRVK